MFFAETGKPGQYPLSRGCDGDSRQNDDDSDYKTQCQLFPEQQHAEADYCCQKIKRNSLWKNQESRCGSVVIAVFLLQQPFSMEHEIIRKISAPESEISGAGIFIS